MVADFDSGEPTLDEYLRGRALAVAAAHFDFEPAPIDRMHLLRLINEVLALLHPPQR